MHVLQCGRAFAKTADTPEDIVMTKFRLMLVTALIVGSALAVLADPKALQIPSSPSPDSATTTSGGQDASGSTIGPRGERELWINRRR